MFRCQWCGKEACSIWEKYCCNSCKHQALQTKGKSGDVSTSNGLPGWLTVVAIGLLVYGLFFGKCNDSNSSNKKLDSSHPSSQTPPSDTINILSKSFEDSNSEVNFTDTTTQTVKSTDENCINKYGIDFVSYCEAGNYDDVVNTYSKCNGLVNFQLSNNKRFALLEASDHNRSNIVTFLLQNNADPNISDEDGRTPLIEAVDREYIEIVNILLSNNADVNKQEKHGNTALVIAINKKNIPIINSILTHSPNLEIMNNKGETAINLSIKNRNKEIRNIFAKLTDTPIN
jgi:ankyrin repeat protein